jgi:hypothetical protein
MFGWIGKGNMGEQRWFILNAVSIAVLVAGCKYTDPSDENAMVGNTDYRPIASRHEEASMNSPLLRNAKENGTKGWGNPRRNVTGTLVSVKESGLGAWSDVRESLGSLRSYPYSRKDNFVADAQNDLDKLDEKIAGLANRIANVSDATKIDAQKRLQGIQNKRAVMDRKLSNAREATAADWDDAKVAFKDSYEDLKKSLRETWNWLRDQTG